MDGILLIDKPPGPTSHDVVAKLRRHLDTRRIGHAGTLDPIASGLLVCLVGQATKISPFIVGHRKTYLATAILNEMRDTYDRAGQVVRIIPPSQRIVSWEELAEAVRHFPQRYDQRPPPYSAKKIGGRAAYKLAREGVAVELKRQSVEIYAFSVVDFAFPRVELRVEVSAGTYVRSLVVDLAERLGTVGYVDALRRTASGLFTIDQAIGLDEALARSPAEVRSRLMPIGSALTDMTNTVLTDPQRWAFCNGQTVTVDDVPVDTGQVAVYCHDTLIGVGTLSNGQLRPTRVLRR